MNGYLYHYRRGITSVITSDKLSRETIYGLAQARDGTLWIGTANGLFLLAHGQLSRYRPREELPVAGFYDLAVTDEANLFAAKDRGVLQIQGYKWRFGTVKNGLPSDHIQVLAAPPGDVLWIGTIAGLAQLSRGQAQTIKTPPCVVGGMNVDREGSLWLGCEHTGGLLHLYKPVVKLIAPSTSLPIVRVSSLVEDRAGVVWMATVRGLLRWKNNQSRLYATRDGLPTDLLTTVSLAPDGSVWMATEDGFARIHNGKIESFRTQKPGREDPVDSILEDRKGTLWVGTPGALLSRAPGQTRLQETHRISANTWSIREDREGNIWAATVERHSSACPVLRKRNSLPHAAWHQTKFAIVWRTSTGTSGP